jgi:hypothetical protein
VTLLQVHSLHPLHHALKKINLIIIVDKTRTSDPFLGTQSPPSEPCSAKKLFIDIDGHEPVTLLQLHTQSTPSAPCSATKNLNFNLFSTSNWHVWACVHTMKNLPICHCTKTCPDKRPRQSSPWTNMFKHQTICFITLLPKSKYIVCTKSYSQT